ncbi:hypothetical protein SPFL3102_02820 [Sporomusaceae bacterium FL31]|nr:hypothetical protein SPFL3101_01150 [Sporomusaceae bacterium FL31]GCE34992.1 hypothetical protein SPFL3102_02820 [Sporomusaceae bacterium]
MKKKFAIVLGTAFSLSVAGTVLAAPANLFAVIPSNHWSYSAVGQLAQAGLVEGFGGSAYRGDVILTRVEMAAIVAKAIAKADKAGSQEQAVIQKLQAEFSPELNMSMGGTDTTTENRLTALEKSKPAVKFSGDSRIRYQTNWNQAAKNTDTKNNNRIEHRLRMNLVSDLNEDMSLLARIAATNRSNVRAVNGSTETSTNNTVSFDRMEIQWRNKSTVYSAGRMLPGLGQGLLWDSVSLDGAMATYKYDNIQYLAGFGDLAAYTGSGKTTNAFFGTVKVQTGPSANVTLTRIDTMTNSVDIDGLAYNLEQTSLGFTTRSGEFTMTGEYVKNSDSKLPVGAQDHGYWTRLLWKGIDNSKPGTFGVSFDYLEMGNYAVDSTSNPSNLVISSGNGWGKDGAKGYGFGAQYVVAKNANLEARYYNLKPYDQGKSGFSSYKPSYHLIGNFKF